MQKIIFTNSNDVTFESDKINKMFENGLDILHIRKSEYTEEKLRRYINNIDKKYHSKIVIHEFFNLLDEYDLKGIHINRENRNSFWFNFFTLKRIK
jgi:thiamine-phosphate pyrophosphorylase